METKPIVELYIFKHPTDEQFIGKIDISSNNNLLSVPFE